MAWSPDGKSLLLQEAEVLKSKEATPCKPLQLWLYRMADNSWTKTATPPNESPGYEGLWHVDWSPDGRWASWDNTFIILVYDTKSWNIVRSINLLSSNYSRLDEIWMRDSAGNSILAIDESSLTEGLLTYTLIGSSPNGTEKDDKQLAEILRVPEWLPVSDTAGFYTPLSWQP
jgi:hypothetical protein